MKRLTILAVMLMTGCKTTNTPNLDLNLVNMNVHPLVTVDALKKNEKGEYQNNWVEFEFELIEGKYGGLKPSNIIVIKSDGSESSGFTAKAKEALKKWVYNKEFLPNYKSNRYVVRLTSEPSQEHDGYQCKFVSCIKI